MTPKVTTHPWSEESLFAKSVLYAERMESTTADDWQFGFWSALTLELLARAALAHISPILLGDGANWRNLVYALDGELTAKKFSPGSIGTKEALARLTELLPSFTEEVAGFCTKHAGRRNSELHTGEAAFVTLGTSEWLPRFYLACKILLESMGRSLPDLFSHAKTAQQLIDSLEDAAAKTVSKDINAHAQVWTNKNDTERNSAKAQAELWATRQAGHRVTCPACKSPALVQGTPSGRVASTFTDEEVVQRQTVLPASFECIACGLHVSGLSKLSACGLGDAFTAKSTFSIAEFFGLYTDDDLEEARKSAEPEYDEDFND